MGTGFLVAGGFADIARNVPRDVAGRVTGAMIAGTALGGLLSRVAGYSGLLVGWRGAFAVGAAALLGAVLLALRLLPPESEAGARRVAAASGRMPWPVIAAGLGVLFVNVGMFDLLPYRLSAPPFRLPAAFADLVYLTYIPGSFFAGLAGRAVDRHGARAVILAVAAEGILLLLAGILPLLPALVLAGLGAICGTSSLHVAYSGTAARFGRAAVGRYLAAYYVGGAAAAPLLAAVYRRAGWPAAVLVLCAAWAGVAVLAAVAGKEADGPEVERAELEGPPARGLG